MRVGNLECYSCMEPLAYRLPVRPARGKLNLIRPLVCAPPTVWHLCDFVSDEEAAALERCADVGMAEARYVDGRKVQSIGGTPRPPPIEMLPEAMCAAPLIHGISARHSCTHC